MWHYKIRAIALTGIVCVFVVWTTPVRSQEQDSVPEANAEQVEAVQPSPPPDPQAATTTTELDIPVDELKLLVKPLTLEELQTEAAGWMLVLHNKAKEISVAEVTIKRKNEAIGQQQEATDALETAKQSLEEAEKLQKGAVAGSPEYQEATKKVEEAKEHLKKAQESVEDAKTTKEELKQDETSQQALEQAEKTDTLETVKQILDQTKADRDQMIAGDFAYEEATQKIEKLEAGIKGFEDAQEAQKGINPHSPEYQVATEKVEQAYQSLKQLLEELGASTTDQSSQHFDNATATLQNTEIQHNAEEKVASLPGAVDNPQNLQKQQEHLEKTTQQLEKSTEAESDAKNQLIVTVTELQSQLTAIVDRFNVILDELDKKGGDSKAYRQYIQAITAVEIDTKDTEGVGLRLLSWAKSSEGGLRWGTNIAKFVGVLVACIIVSQILGMVTNRLLSLFTGTSAMMRRFTVMTIKRGGVVIGFLLALTALEVSLGPVLALLGGVSFVLAFALQSNLGNLASGLMIMIYKPFDVGDEIKFGEIWGYVDSITLANTKIQGFDSQIISIPNNTLWSEIVENLSHGSTRQLNFWFRVGFDEDLAKVELLLIDILQSHPQVLPDPAPSTFVWSIEDYYISVKAAAWTTKDNFWVAHSDLIRMIRKCFDQEGIKLAAIPASIEISGEDDSKILEAAQVTQDKISLTK
ncbi:putative MscS family protein slr0639 [Planktothrix tepida]|nr:mechanosensitive ion channel family protein [Planktothrix tepida]CAD5916988.1 putative MscS family protein slr0639 [Planktothrix tepida]